jgi:hypothetical protein
METEEKLQKEAIKAITAFRQLFALKMLSNVECADIQERINDKYGEYLSPLRNED